LANIDIHLQKIMEAVYGEEVRGSIHDALAAMNEESSSALAFAATAKDSAQASARSAQNSASVAVEKANDAAASVKEAKASEDNAKASEAAVTAKASEAAKASAEAVSAFAGAKASEASAAKSEAASIQNAQEAANSKLAAERAAIDAAESALSAQQYSGKPPKPQNGTWWIWDVDQQGYIDSGIGCELVGPAGNGIRDIKLTEGDHTPGTTDIYTVTMTDGSTFSISVYNGRNGAGAGDVLGIWFDLLLPASGWANGEITVADSRLVALSTHKYFISADEASREKYLECKVRPRDIATTGFITFKNGTDPTEDITVNVIRFEMSANGTAG